MNEGISQNLDDIQIVEPQSSFDATKFEGQRIQIAKAEKKQVRNLFPDGEYNPDSTEMRWVVEITTAPLFEVDSNGNKTDKLVEWKQEDGTVKHLTVTHRFNLQELTDETGTKVVISKHPKAALWKFMRKMGVTKPSELVGKLVTITTVPSKNPEDDRHFLSIAV